MSVLVTGGAGFIGSHLIERLLAEQREVVCLDNFNSFYNPQIKQRNVEPFLKNKNFRLVTGDILNRNLLRKLFKESSIDRVVHLAARASVRPSLRYPLLYEEVNVKGTITLLEEAKEFKVKNFIFGSSSSVYGINHKTPFSEDDKVESPISAYGASKRAGELYCFTYHHLYGIPIICLRLFTVYGPRQRPDMAIHKFTRLISLDQEIPVFGNGRIRRDYTFISDIIDGILRGLDEQFNFEIFNLGNSEMVELNYLISLIEENLGKKAKIKYLPNQPGDVPITCADITKSRKILGYEPKVKIKEGVRRFVQWFKDQEDLG